MNTFYVVYIHTAPNDKKYIGITCQDIKLRWRNGKGYIKNKYFYRAIQKFGWDNFKHDILFSGLTLEEAEKIEFNLINELKTNEKEFGFNLKSGGNAYGTFSEESKRKMSISSTGKKHTEETKQKISKNGKGIKKSAETREKMRLAWIGEKNHRYGIIPKSAKKVQQISLDGQIIAEYKSSSEAQKITGILARSIRAVCCGKRHTTGGYKWRFV